MGQDKKMRIRKRDLTLVDFDRNRIENAIQKAAQSVEQTIDVRGVAQKIIDCLPKDAEEIHIEQIQDYVEQELMNAGHYHVLRHYITYRNEKQKQRDMGVLNLKNLPHIDPPFKEIGYITYKRTYARDNEEFKDTILRVLIGCQKQLGVGFTNDELKMAYDHFMNLRCSVAGRFLWQLNTETVSRLGLMSLQNCAFCKIDSIRSFTFLKDVLMLGVGCGVNIQRHNTDKLPPVLDKDIQIVRKDTKDADFIIPDSREGWVGFLERVLEAYFYKGKGFTYSTICIRSAGSPIIGFGGVASGPNILCEGIQEICKILEKRRGQKLHPIDCMDIADIIGSIVVAGNVRRCLPKGTMVHTRAGMVPIERVRVGDMVQTSFGVYQKVSAVCDQGVQKTIQITTGDGVFRCTPNHRMAVLAPGNYIRWKEASTLTKKDRLITSRVPVKGDHTSIPLYKEGHPVLLDTRVAWLLGYSLHSKDKDYILHARNIQIATKLRDAILCFDADLDVILHKIHNNDFLVIIEGENKTHLRSYMEQHIPPNQVPDFIWRAYSHIREAFLAGVMDSSPTMVLYSNSKEWTQSIQTLFYSCGIEMRMKTRRLESNPYSLQPSNAYSKEMIKNIPHLVGKKKLKKTFWEMLCTPSYELLSSINVVGTNEEEKEEHTFDIMVDGEHNFYANGYLTHNSAILIMGDADDKEYLQAKRWDLGNIPNYRAMSNNSVICNDINELPEEFWEGYKGNGEPYGLINLRLARGCGRLKDGDKYPDVVEGFNPCLTPDTMIMTTQGYTPIRELIGKPFEVVADGGVYSSTKKGFWHTGKKQIFRVRLENGIDVKATSNHFFMTFSGWKRVGELSMEDTIILSSCGDYQWSGKGTEDEGYIVGSLMKNKLHYPTISVLLSKDIEPHDFGPIQKITGFYHDKKGKTKEFNLIGKDICYKKYSMTSSLFRDIATEYGLFGEDGKTHVYEKGSYDFTIGLLKGVFDSSGIIYNNIHDRMSIRLWDYDKGVLRSVQRLLLAVGIVGKMVVHHTKGYELVVQGDENMQIFQEKIGFLNNEKCLLLSQYTPSGDRRKSHYCSRVVSIESFGEDDVYDCTIEKSHFFSANGILSHNCAEQGLANFETCCLSEIFLPNIEDYEQLKSVATTLYRICKHSLLLPCHHQETEKIVHDNMRMGIGISGILQSSETQLGWLDDLYEYLRGYDQQYSQKLGVQPSIKLTTVKPSGTLSLLGGCTPGIHPALYRYYIRRIRIATNNPLVEVCRQHGYHVECQKNFDGTLDTKTMVVEFPCRTPENAVLSDDMTAIDQLEKVRQLQTIYSDNAISCTIYMNKDELPAIREWLSKNYNHNVKTCSFLLRYDHGFVQAPFEPITRERYEELIQKVKPITGGMIIPNDDTDNSSECAGGMCPVK